MKPSNFKRTKARFLALCLVRYWGYDVFCFVESYVKIY